MHNELRYQAKIHTISAKLFKRENKILHIFPQNLFIFFLKKKKKQERHASTIKKINLHLACVARSNLSIRRKDQNYQYRKSSCPTCFFCHPQIVPVNFFSTTTREIGKKITMVPKLYGKQRYAR
jgi:hypothetical protein